MGFHGPEKAEFHNGFEQNNHTDPESEFVPFRGREEREKTKEIQKPGSDNSGSEKSIQQEERRSYAF